MENSMMHPEYSLFLEFEINFSSLKPNIELKSETYIHTRAVIDIHFFYSIIDIFFPFR